MSLDNWLVAAIVALSVVYLLSRIAAFRSAKNVRGCGACATCPGNDMENRTAPREDLITLDGLSESARRVRNAPASTR